MTKEEQENLIIKVTKMGIDIAQLRGKLEAMKTENKFLRAVLSKYFQRPTISGISGSCPDEKINLK